MLISKSIPLVIFMVIIVIVFILFMNVKAAGQIRQARFNMTGLQSVISQYYKVNGHYPVALSDLPKFYAVSAMDKLYFDFGHFTDGEFGGYRYDFNLPSEGKFVLSASPQHLWPKAVEFGLTQAGNLKMNVRNVDELPDTYDEVDHWQAAGF